MNSSRYEPETITCRDFSKYNVDEINNELLDANWDSVYDSQFPVVKLKNFSNLVGYLKPSCPIHHQTYQNKTFQNSKSFTSN